MNGRNDYIEIAQEQAEEINKAYILAIERCEEEVPQEFERKWIDKYLEGRE